MKTREKITMIFVVPSNERVPWFWPCNFFTSGQTITNTFAETAQRLGSKFATFLDFFFFFFFFANCEG